MIDHFSGFRPNTKRPRKVYASAQERAAWVVRFQKSGLSARTFAAAEGLVLSSLQRWRRQYLSRPTAPRFKELPVIPPPRGGVGSGWDAEVSLPSGLSVRLRGEWARDVVRNLLPGVS